MAETNDAASAPYTVEADEKTGLYYIVGPFVNPVTGLLFTRRLADTWAERLNNAYHNGALSRDTGCREQQGRD